MDKKTIVVGVSGGIAAYKACEIVSLLVKSGYNVSVVMTKNATQFVAPLTFETLTGAPVVVDLFDNDESCFAHITLAMKACAFVIAPCTGNVLAKIANGIADDALTSTFLAATCPVIVAPAMNVHMYQNPATQANIQTLQNRGVIVLDADCGRLACGEVGQGRLPEPNVIVEEVLRVVS